MKFFRKKSLMLISLALILMLAVGCTSSNQTTPGNDNKEPENTAQETKSITLATTTSTEDSGLLDAILPDFEEKYNIDVKVIAVGTGQAIETGERGDADVILVHARAAEDKFVDEGYGVNRKDVMYNDFVIVGPSDDPAGIKGGNDAVAAFKAISENKASFVSRGDNSGTNKKEISLWEKTEITPAGDWYIESGQGMGNTLQMANEKNAYTLADRATYLAYKDKIGLEIVVEGDEALFNPYGVIAVNPEKHENVKYEEAMQFIEWLTSPECQDKIKTYGTEKFGQPLFVPNAK